MSEELTFQGFVEFVKSQPPEDEINHTMWGTCAVGDYTCHVLGPGPGPDAAENFADGIIDVESPELYDALNEYGYSGIGETYGTLQEYLQNAGY